ncbi:hypothetical protein OJ996_17425 [Luteolibacter sp. GHJ8]|uniref:Uncharacterized protein n=1 Tax=Luteolibacter rhizosphaerae TaxID=2989719 RepID=A0ABT3G722_9BACT|nr:hypothetical protein [Luteolibacter rhizosphaerae]MCW1915369.1 hypothetical protein [Luteolibacter rhizosphaerae]
MKTLFLHLLAFCAVLAPVNMAQARAPKPPVIIGGFEVGKTFTLPITFRDSSSQVAGGEPQPVAPPAGIPAYTEGQQIKFTIGKKGELLAPGIKIPFKTATDQNNIYVGLPTRKAPTPPLATVYKNSEGEPTGVWLQFVKVKIVKRIPTVYYVNYGVGDFPR